MQAATRFRMMSRSSSSVGIPSQARRHAVIRRAPAASSRAPALGPVMSASGSWDPRTDLSDEAIVFRADEFVAFARRFLQTGAIRDADRASLIFDQPPPPQ